MPKDGTPRSSASMSAFRVKLHARIWTSRLIYFLAFHFAAGLTTGCISASLLQPADLLKTRVQQSRSSSLFITVRHILAGPNVAKQLWRGTLPSVIRTGFGSALYFSMLNALRQNAARSDVLTSRGFVEAVRGNGHSSSSSSLPRLGYMANMTTGAMARGSAGMIMMPITIIKVRYESSIYSYKSMLGAGMAIFQNEGIKGFFSGYGATAARDAPYAGLYVLFYEQSKRYLSQLTAFNPLADTAVARGEMRSRTSVSINFLSGIVAATLATAITNPFDAVKTRLQIMPQKYSNMLKAGPLMIKEDGVRSLFDGLALRMGRKALSSALAWALYEELVRRAEMSFEERSGTKA